MTGAGTGADTGAAERARAYYRALDEHEYDALADLLAPEFVHERPDRTLAGRERFVQFMREERPRKNTTHCVETVYRPLSGVDAHGADGDGATAERVAVEGRLLDDGECFVEFVDVFTMADGSIRRLDTYARSGD